MRIKIKAEDYLATAAIVAAATAIASAVVWFAPLDSVSAIYMLPVLIAAVRYGSGPAVFAALTGAFMTSLFYPPLFSPLVFRPSQIIDLMTSLVVALTVGHLAGRLRAQMLRATESERATRQVYALGSALAEATDVDAVYGIVAGHVSEALERPVAIFAGSPSAGFHDIRSRFGEETTTELSRRVASFLDHAESPAIDGFALDGRHWLLCRISGGVQRAALAVDLPSADNDALKEASARAAELLGEASRSLERLGLSRIVEERRLRQRTDTLRDTLVEAVSHDLRTPITGIMGAASVLAAAPHLAAHPSLTELASGIEQEAGRLDRLIQDVLDLGRIRAGALQARLEAIDPGDLIEAALQATTDRLRDHVIRCRIDPTLPPVSADPTLVLQALINVLENAAKYTAAGRAVDVGAEADGDAIALIVRDEGAGLSAGETDRVFERFRRGEVHADSAGGSGLGLTIARVFVEACGGRLVALSAGKDRGTTLRLVLPIAETRRISDDEE